jgi:hypothetical protein
MVLHKTPGKCYTLNARRVDEGYRKTANAATGACEVFRF